MPQTILVAIDDSSCARKALQQAVSLAASTQARLEILHVVDYGYLKYDLGYVDAGALGPQLVVAGEELLRDAAAAADAAGVSCGVHLVNDVLTLGDIPSAVRQAASECKADMIVIGTHGRHGLRRLLLGSVAESLARECEVPVLLVREPAAAAGGQQAEARAAA
ncbi:universal stress protein UspA [Cupriavidus sp. USMAA2-4]|uniref:Universal stress protein n=1 Tax=Cupriavidus malaysiensis TaxID=367825 RepID=A0ABN4TXQ4_9BURK|nr:MULTISPECIES: universal stress protein [Cupriavidus]AOY95030.1 universal stress protein UspA [Cupriavidus sp. USMAA2-4]AOZ02076.1 universal stress protein UspA [Cupriavidus sp. USMAHM13]AOZ10535.1 universal stress protein UspA [Cupriavidus malaysiensis]